MQESSQTRDRTCVPCIDRQILNHWITREVQLGTSCTRTSDCSLSEVRQARGGGPGPAVPGVLTCWGLGAPTLKGLCDLAVLLIEQRYFWVLFTRLLVRRGRVLEDRGCAAGGTGGHSVQLPAIPGQNPESVLGEGNSVDPGLQAPGQWLVAFPISAKGGKQAGTWGLPPLLGTPFQEVIEVSCCTSSGAHISYLNRLSCLLFLVLLSESHGESQPRWEGTHSSPLPMPFQFIACWAVLVS